MQRARDDAVALAHEVDDQRLATVAAREQVGVVDFCFCRSGTRRSYIVGMSVNQPACPTASSGLCSSRLRPVRRPG
jgi:hypothetical protein